jgi:hypothetical protein
MTNRHIYSRRLGPTLPVLCALAVALLAELAAMAIPSTGSAQGSVQRQAAHAARALNVTDTARLEFVGESGSSLVDEGKATGELPGKVKVLFNVGATVRASFTIYTRNWSLVGIGSGTLSEPKRNHSQRDPYESFGGTMKISHGTGHYAHAHGTGGFYGVINRETRAVTIQTTGTLSY